MKQSILDTDQATFIKKLRIKKIICIAVLCLALGCNLLLTLLRNDQNHTLLLWLNIAIDVAVGWFLIFYISLQIAPRKRLLRICSGTKSTFSGTVTQITTQTQKVRHIDCFTVSLAETRRQFFLPVTGALSLTEGMHVQIIVVANVIVEIM